MNEIGRGKLWTIRSSMIWQGKPLKKQGFSVILTGIGYFVIVRSPS